MRNTNHLISRVLLIDERFAVVKIFKNMDVTNTGVLVGVGQELASRPVQSSSVKLFFEDGVVRYDRGQLTSVKTLSQDPRRRVSEIALIEGGRLVDTWRYEYNERTGRRSAKLVVRPGERPHLRIPYDADGNMGPEQQLRV